MMIKTTIVRLLFFLLVVNCKLYGQFNTLTRSFTGTTKLSDPIASERRKIPDKSTERNRWRLKKTTTKSQLKKEIDSLKMMILQMNENKPQVVKFEFKRIEDSLMMLIKDRIQNLKTEDKKPETVNTPEMTARVIGKSFFPQFKMPLQNRLIITSSFGNRGHPIFKNVRLHNGVDLRANYERVFAVLDGYVMEAGWDKGGGGNYMKIRHSESYITSYLHLSEIYYKAGEFVKAGYVIGKSGSTGNSTGPHLHFSVSEKGKFINPIGFLNNLIKTNNLFTKYYER